MCSHLYERFDKPNVVVDSTRGSRRRERRLMQRQDKVHRRVRELLGWQAPPAGAGQPGADKYGMGTERPLRRYMDEAGIDPRARRVGDHCGAGAPAGR